MIIYDIDKMIRDPLVIKAGGKEYEIEEPTVKVFGLIQKELAKRIEADPVEGQNWFISLLIPHLPLENLTSSEMKMVGSICSRVLTGVHQEGKLQAPEEIMKKIP